MLPVELPIAKATHDVVTFVSGHASVKQREAPGREWTRGERLEHRRRRLEIDLLRLFDDRVDDVRLPPFLYLSVHERQHAVTRGLATKRRGDGTATRRPLIENAQIELAVQRERERSRNRRGRHEQYVG